MAELLDGLRVRCRFCSWKWIAIFPPGTNVERLECPKCGTFSSKPDGPSTDPQDDPRNAE